MGLKLEVKNRLGSTIIEVLISAVILASCAVVVGGLLLSTLGFAKRDSTKYEMVLAGRKLREELKSYVTANTSVTLHAPGSPPWHLPEDSSCTDCWALTEGHHNATAMLPQRLRDTYSATMAYDVSWPGAGQPQTPRVEITLSWER